MEALPNQVTQDKEILKPWIDPHKLKQHQGTWYKEGRQVIMGDADEKHRIIRDHHDSLVYRHPGISKMIQLTERTYWWPKIHGDIMEYVKGCAECQ
jgi:hypothetical protein